MNIALFISNKEGIKLYKYLINKKIKINLIIWNGNLNYKLYSLRNNNIVIYDKNNIDLIINSLKYFNIDLGITYFFPILSKKIWKVPTYNIINTHYSLLYSYGGPNPVEWQLYNNEKESGITIHFISSKIDQGNIIIQKKIDIPKPKYLLYYKLNKLSKECIYDAIQLIDKYKYKVPIVISSYKKSYYSFFNKNILKCYI